MGINVCYEGSVPNVAYSNNSFQFYFNLHLWLLSLKQFNPVPSQFPEENCW